MNDEIEAIRKDLFFWSPGTARDYLTDALVDNPETLVVRLLDKSNGLVWKTRHGQQFKITLTEIHDYPEQS